MDKYKDEEILIEDNEATYNLKSPFLKGEVVKDHVNRCLIARSKEMKKGYFNFSVSNSGEELKEYIQDTRKAFISSVSALKSLLYPEILSSEYSKIKNQIIELEEEEEKIFEKYCYKEKILVKNELKETGDKYIPEEDEEIFVKIKSSEGSKYDKRKGVWNYKVNLYWNKLVDIYDKVFAILNKLVDELDYFNPESADY